jgi:hypothetical protein
MARAHPHVLALNAGSSSIKFALYESGSWAAPILRGKLDQRGSTEATLSWVATAGGSEHTNVHVADHASAAHLLDWLEGRSELSGVKGMGHRIVHGMGHAEPARVTPALLQELRGLIPYAPDHLPIELELSDLVSARYPERPQVTCFDTAFHHDLIPAARVINVVDPMKLQPISLHPHGLSDKEFDVLFTTDKPVIFAYHGYPPLIHRLTYRRRNHQNVHVSGYQEEGTTTTPFDMVVLNRLDRFHLVSDVIDRVPALGPRAAYAQQAIRDKLIEHRQYIARYGEDMPEVRNWRWTAGGASAHIERPS